MTRAPETGKTPQKSERDERRAAALRANLRRRKEQERRREAQEKPAPDQK